MKKRLLCFLWGLFLLFFKVDAQVQVHINSGDPAFPFPQFLDYGPDRKTLASVNAPGVTHAEMEQTMRDAWQIFANSFVYAPYEHAGVKYIIGNDNALCGAGGYDCAEGDGYSLIAAAYMADKVTFDGLWFRAHDTRLVLQPRYRDCVVPEPQRANKNHPYFLKDNNGSAADGDFDIALALLMAWKQWGDNSGYVDACGNPISYKNEAINVIRGLVEKVNLNNGNCNRLSGDIGFDGYFKGGDWWEELTGWATGQCPEGPEKAGPREQHIDYMAPAYFNAFAKVMEQEGQPQWNIDQFKRGEASSDWLMGKMLDNPVTLPLAGNVSLDASNNPTYSNFSDGEDFRNPWRTILNYVWHGNPETSWDPVTHQVVAGGNSYEKNIGKRLAEFLSNPGKAPWSNACSDPGGGAPLTYNGPSQLKYYYDPNTGKEKTTFVLNWLMGTGTPAAVAAQDFDLMGKLYRQCAIEWGMKAEGDGYLTSVPTYFHGFVRLLGMMIVSGNHHDPLLLKKEANMKVYGMVDKTYAFTGDELNYVFRYRNYASVNAENVKITTSLPHGLEFVSASNGGSHAGGLVTWDLGTVPGFRSATGAAATEGQVTLTVKVAPGFSGQICSTADITTSNGTGWTSNRYPNNMTAVMEINCVDVVEKALKIEKTASYRKVNPGNKVTYTVNFENASSGGFINGGRQGVNFSYAHDGTAATASQHGFKIRLFHGAVEPYIDYANYRISLFLNDNTYNCIYGQPGCTGNGWMLSNDIYDGGDTSGVIVSTQAITPGSDSRGAWNQRVMVQFAHQLTTTTPHISRYYGQKRVHQGGDEPLRAKWRLHANNFAPVKWDDDWSWNPDVAEAADSGLYYPVTNDFTDINNPNVPVTVWHNEACEKPSQFTDNILVEEWDGYTWRRVFGNSPLPGRDVENVVVRDVLPAGFAFEGFVDGNGINVGNTISILGQVAAYDAATRTITWTIPRLQIKQKGTIKYIAAAGFTSGTCPRADELQINTASIEGTNETAVTDTAGVTVTCDPVILPPDSSSMTKTADKADYMVGDNITYTLSYKNTDGSIAVADLSSAANWVAQSGTAMPVATGSLKSISTDPGVMTYRYSHGKNGTIEASISFHPNAVFGLAFRHTGGAKTNGQYIIFKPNPGAGTIEVRAYEGTTQLGIAQSTGFSGDPVIIRLELDGTKVNLWIGNVSNPVPTLTFTGFAEKAGYAGVINGWADNGSESHGVHSLVNFKTHLDSGFDLQFTDPVPEGLTFVSASDAGTNNNGTVQFPTEPGPVPADAVITRTWTATVATCPTGGKIVNNAYTEILGHTPNSIASQVVVNCRTTPCNAPTTVTITGDSLLVPGTRITLTAAITPVATGLSYRWFKLPDLSTPVKAGTDSVKLVLSAVSDTGRYVVRVSDPNDPSCFKDSRVKTVRSQCTPIPVSIGQPDSYCRNQSGVSLTATPGRAGYIWFRENVQQGQPTANNTYTNAKAGVWKVVAFTTTGCRDTSLAVTVTARPVPPAVITTQVLSYCDPQPGVQLDAQNAGPNATYEWIVVPATSGTPSPNAFYPNATEGSYRVKVSLDGCDSTSAPVTVSRSSTAAIKITGDTSLCKGDTLKLSTNLRADLLWTLPDNTTQETGDLILLTFEPGIYIAQTPAGSACAGSDTVTVLENPALTVTLSGKDTSYCTDQPGATLTATASQPGALYEWFKDGLSTGTPTTQNQLTEVKEGAFYVKASNGACTGTSDTIRVKPATIRGPQFNIRPNTTDTCANSMVSLALEGDTGKVEWYLGGTLQRTGPTFDFRLAETTEVSVIYTPLLSCIIPKDPQPNSVIINASTPVSPSVIIESSQPSVDNCEGDELIFSMVSSENGGTNPSFQWYVNGDTAAGETDPSRFALENWTNNTTVELEITRNQGCSLQKSVRSNIITLNGTPNQDLDLQITGITSNLVDGYGCQGQEVILSVQTNIQDPRMSYFWRNGSDAPAFGDPGYRHFLNRTITDTISVRVPGCYTGNSSATETILLRIELQLTVSINGNVNGKYTHSACAGDPLTFSVDTSGRISSLSWYRNGDPLDMQGDSVTISELADGDLIKVVAEPISACVQRAADSTLLKIDAKPAASFTNGAGPVDFCQGESVLLSSAETNPAYQYVWIRDTVAMGPTSTSVTVSQAGKYVLQITNGNCKVDTSIVVRQSSISVKASAEPAEFYSGQTVNLKAELSGTESNVTYQWVPQEIIAENTIASPIAKPAKTVYAKVFVRDEKGCTDADSVLLTLKSKLFIPNALVPGTLDQNAFWGIKGAEGFPDIDIRVFNRWGNTVYQTRGYSTPWDGTVNGKELPAGTYYYVIRDASFDKPLTGDLTIIR